MLFLRQSPCLLFSLSPGGGWGGVSCDLMAPWSYESWDPRGRRSGEGYTSPVSLPSYAEPTSFWSNHGVLPLECGQRWAAGLPPKPWKDTERRAPWGCTDMSLVSWRPCLPPLLHPQAPWQRGGLYCLCSYVSHRAASLPERSPPGLALNVLKLRTKENLRQ